MGAGTVYAHVNAGAANAEWKSIIQRGNPTPARSKCPGCGSWEHSHTKGGLVCAYCRIPAAHSLPHARAHVCGGG